MADDTDLTCCLSTIARAFTHTFFLRKFPAPTKPTTSTSTILQVRKLCSKLKLWLKHYRIYFMKKKLNELTKNICITQSTTAGGLISQHRESDNCACGRLTSSWSMVICFIVRSISWHRFSISRWSWGWVRDTFFTLSSEWPVKTNDWNPLKMLWNDSKNLRNKQHSNQPDIKKRLSRQNYQLKFFQLFFSRHAKEA